jgi:prepilin-type N-terminal cleavage/methylation domain-containing protein/prepilin-type processing-associated H-X9-DG protein
MKPRGPNQRNQALTLLEVLVVIAVLAILAVMLLPHATGNKRLAPRVECVSNLKQIGEACRIWADDHNDKYPMQVSATNSGVMELIATGNVAACFQIMSNELSTPEILVCPADTTRILATNFAKDLSGSNISYFVGLDADAVQPQTLLSGDDNFIVNGKQVHSGFINLHTSDSLAWTKERHQGTGNILLADGSVRQTSSAELNSMAKLATDCLVIP